MRFRILYCGVCGYRDRAEDLADELRRRFGAEASVSEGKLGQFDVLLDGELVASKGGFFKRMLEHGPPAQEQMLDTIERAMAERPGDVCEPPALQNR